MRTQNAALTADASLEAREAASFRQAIANCFKVFGDEAFKLKKDPNKRANRSAPYADAVMQALADRSPASLTPDAVARIRAAFEELCTQNQDFRSAVEKGTNGESAIKNRITLARASVDKALKLAKQTSSRRTTTKRSSKKQ